jgi:hypothetical protein
LDFGFSVGIMLSKTFPQSVERAQRFGLHFAVSFRRLDSPTWSEGRTENISYTGMLLLCPQPLAPETELELRLQLAVGAKGRDPSEIRCKGAVVRMEQRAVPENPVALGVVIRDYRIVRQQLFNESPPGDA